MRLNDIIQRMGNDSENPPARLLYGTDELFDEIDDKYEELCPEFRSEHEKRLTKIRHFYPALLRAGVRGTSIEEELDLDHE